MSHLAAIMALVPEGIAVHDTDVTAPIDEDTGDALPLAYPYVVFSAPNFPQVRLSVNDELTAVDGYFQATVVALTVEQVRFWSPVVRTALDGASPALEGFATQVRHVRSEQLDVDRSVTLPESGHPAYIPERYRYRATPA